LVIEKSLSSPAVPLKKKGALESSKYKFFDHHRSHAAAAAAARLDRVARPTQQHLPTLHTKKQSLGEKISLIHHEKRVRPPARAAGPGFLPAACGAGAKRKTF
jgi:hypothetical protein